MEERIKYDMSWDAGVISLKNAKKGHIYVTRKDDKTGETNVIMYLGQLKNGKHAFYHFAKARLVPAGGSRYHQTFGNYDAQVGGIRQIITMSMETRAYADSIVSYDKNPGIVGEFPFQDYADVYLDWYNKSFTETDNVPEISAGKVKTDYVKVQDLVLGGLYYTSPAGTIFMYLGRRSDGMFVWSNVYNRERLAEMLEDIEVMYANADVTVSNKHCKPITCGPKDDDICYEWRKDNICELVENPLKFDTFRINQALIDTAGPGVGNLVRH